MVVTKEVDLPTYGELTVEEANLSLVTLLAAGPHLGKRCESVNNEYMLCRQELNDPRPCVDLGKEVTACALATLRNIKASCVKEFKQYAKCLEKSSGDYGYSHCRNTQCVLDCCLKDRLGWERPDFGYFCRPRVHQSSSKPPPLPDCPCEPKVHDPTPALPECKARYPARFSSRHYWMNE